MVDDQYNISLKTKDILANVKSTKKNNHSYTPKNNTKIPLNANLTTIQIGNIEKISTQPNDCTKYVANNFILN